MKTSTQILKDNIEKLTKELQENKIKYKGKKKVNYNSFSNKKNNKQERNKPSVTN